MISSIPLHVKESEFFCSFVSSLSENMVIPTFLRVDLAIFQFLQIITFTFFLIFSVFFHSFAVFSGICTPCTGFTILGSSVLFYHYPLIAFCATDDFFFFIQIVVCDKVAKRSNRQYRSTFPINVINFYGT